jgi:hypothetical protein
MDNLLPELVSLLIETIPDSRPLFLTCKGIYSLARVDRTYWEGREIIRIANHPPKLPTDEKIITFIEHGNIAMVRYLYEKGDRGCIPDMVFAACRTDQLEILEYLDSVGVSLTSADNYAIVCASGFGHLRIVKWLNQKGLPINAREGAGLIWASGSNRLQVVEFLHTNGIDIKTRIGANAFLCASSLGRIEVIKYLHVNGADLSQCGGRSMIRASLKGYLEIVSYLYDAGINNGEVLRASLTAASVSNHENIVKYLSEKIYLLLGSDPE